MPVLVGPEPVIDVDHGSARPTALDPDPGRWRGYRCDGWQQLATQNRLIRELPLAVHGRHAADGTRPLTRRREHLIPAADAHLGR